MVHSRNGRRRHDPPFASIHALTSLSSGGARSVRAVNVAASNVFVAGSNPGCAAPPRHSRSCAPRPRRDSSAVSAASAAIAGSYTRGTTIGGGSPAPSKPSGTSAMIVDQTTRTTTLLRRRRRPFGAPRPRRRLGPRRRRRAPRPLPRRRYRSRAVSAPRPLSGALLRRDDAGVTIATTPAHDSHASSLANARSSVDVTSVPSSDASSHASRTRSPLDSPGGAIVRTRRRASPRSSCSRRARRTWRPGLGRRRRISAWASWTT